jgi:hypothetical protein
VIGEKFSLDVRTCRNANIDEMIFFMKEKKTREKKNEREEGETEKPQFLLPSVPHSSLLLERCRQLHEEI